MPQYDYLIIGAGLFGSMFAYKATKEGKRCLVVDKRSHLGGNLYCEHREGINIHTYGAHIFHTESKKVWDFVNSLVEFNRFTNSPLASYKGKLYNLPFNMNTFYQMWGVQTPQEAQAKLNEQRSEAVERLKKEGAESPRNLEEQALILVGKDIYETLIKGYTEKQWGRSCKDLPAFIINRLPLRMVYDNNYFNDAYQGIPKGGYNKLIDALLKDVDTITEMDFFAQQSSQKGYKALKDLAEKNGFAANIAISKDNTLQEIWQQLAHRLVFTGKIDEFYNYQFGNLDYRTVSFEQETLPTANYQGNAVVNYTEREVPYTRIIEHKHFEMFGAEVEKTPTTIISKEYSTEWQSGMEPYYPVNNKANNDIYLQYKQLADQEENIIFGGRLAEYKYYDMAPIINKVLNMEIE